MVLGAATATLATIADAISATYTVSVVDRTTSTLYDIVTVTNPNSGVASETLAEGAVFVELEADGGDYFVKYSPMDLPSTMFQKTTMP